MTMPDHVAPDHFSDFAQRLLAERTRQLAARTDAAEGSGGSVAACVLVIGGTRFAMEARHIVRITPARWQEMPLAFDAMPGVRGMHGYLSTLYCVVDPGPALGMAASSAPGVMLLLRPLGTDSRAGAHLALLADQVSDMIAIDPDQTRLAQSSCAHGVPGAGIPAQKSPGRCELVRATDGSLMPFIDPVALFSSYLPGA